MLGAFLFYCRGGLDVEAVPPVPPAATACMPADAATAVAEVVVIAARCFSKVNFVHS